MRTLKPLKARWQELLAVTVRTALLSSVLAGAQATHAQALPLLDTLPISVLGGHFVGAGNGQRFGIAGLTTDGDVVSAGLGQTEMELRNLLPPGQVLDQSRFMLNAWSTEDPTSFLMINLIATTRRCLVTTIDPELNQGNVAGRIIEISTILLNVAPKLPQVSHPVTLCTADSGKLAMHFSTPGFDMVQLTAISYAPPSLNSRTMSSQSVMLYFPVGKF